jgi:choline dehydrogenase
MSDYDYIIAGGGTAGCILANRLSANGKYRVLMLEAGGEASSMWIPMPAGFSKLMTDPRFNWRFQTEPEPGTHGRAIAVPRGKGLGGSTLINGMIYVRGQPQDYDAWRAAGAAGWGADDVEPYFHKIENYARGGPGRGKNGPMYLEQVSERYAVSDAFLQAAQQDGQPLNDDYNDKNQEGFGYYQALQHKGRRWSVADGYLKPALQRKNLTVQTGAHVLRLLLQGRRCVGVVYQKDGNEVTVHAARETLLCLGAVQSPQVLELSGIGSPDILQANGIAVVHPLKSVGENYIDHFATRMNWRVKNTRTLNEMSRGWSLARQVARYFVQHKGILTLGTGLVHGFVKSQPALPTPDVQYFFVHASYANAANRVLDKQPGMTMGVTQLRPQSRGTIHIKSPNAYQCPAIRPNFLDSTVDQESLVRGMQIARRIVEQPAMQRYVDYEMNPGANVNSFDEWLDFARRTGQTIYHPIGTCRMGDDAQAVTDPRLRVNGIANLRVVDASVMPLMVSGNTQAAVMMIAEKGADLILEDARAG